MNHEHNKHLFMFYDFKNQHKMRKAGHSYYFLLLFSKEFVLLKELLSICFRKPYNLSNKKQNKKDRKR